MFRMRIKIRNRFIAELVFAYKEFVSVSWCTTYNVIICNEGKQDTTSLNWTVVIHLDLAEV